MVWENTTKMNLKINKQNIRILKIAENDQIRKYQCNSKDYLI